MTTERVEHILKHFEDLGRGTPTLIAEFHDKENFGSGGTTIELDGLRLHVVNDRLMESLEIGFKTKSGARPIVHPALSDFVDLLDQPTCPLDFLAVMNEWISEDDCLQHYQLTGDAGDDSDNQPPPGSFYDLDDALAILEDDAKWNALTEISESRDLQMAAGSVAASFQQKFIDSMTSSK